MKASAPPELPPRDEISSSSSGHEDENRDQSSIQEHSFPQIMLGNQDTQRRKQSRNNRSVIPGLPHDYLNTLNSMGI